MEVVRSPEQIRDEEAWKTSRSFQPPPPLVGVKEGAPRQRARDNTHWSQVHQWRRYWLGIIAFVSFRCLFVIFVFQSIMASGQGGPTDSSTGGDMEASINVAYLEIDLFESLLVVALGIASAVKYHPLLVMACIALHLICVWFQTAFDRLVAIPFLVVATIEVSFRIAAIYIGFRFQRALAVAFRAGLTVDQLCRSADSILEV